MNDTSFDKDNVTCQIALYDNANKIIDVFVTEDDDHYDVVPYDGDLILVVDDEWFQIEKATHDNVEKLVQTSPRCYSFYRSARITDSSVEGNLFEMRNIAEAILSNCGAVHYRCAVSPHEGGFVFWSPRNSANVGWVTAEAAIALANKIQSLG
jgi:hypothetical protein